MNEADPGGSQAERRCREVRKVLRDGKERDVDQMWSALDPQRHRGHQRRWRRPELQAPVDALVERGHLERHQRGRHFEGEPVEVAPVYAITKTGRAFDG